MVAVFKKIMPKPNIGDRQVAVSKNRQTCNSHNCSEFPLVAHDYCVANTRPTGWSCACTARTGRETLSIDASQTHGPSAARKFFSAAPCLVMPCLLLCDDQLLDVTTGPLFWGMTIMSLRSFYVVPLFVLGLVPGSAVGDIYKWVDAFGQVNISDMPPPKGARLLTVVRSEPEPPPVAAAIGEAELRRLSERIQSLEREINAANRLPTPQLAACDPQAMDCSPWWPPAQVLSEPITVLPFLPNRQGDRRRVGRHHTALQQGRNLSIH